VCSIFIIERVVEMFFKIADIISSFNITSRKAVLHGS
jgi:hypothetical protein